MPASNRHKTTLTDVAKRAGVGSATVDRVLNERGNVSKEVTIRVLEAARELGLRRLLPERHRQTIRIEVILPRPELPLISRLNDEFRSLLSSLDSSIIIQRTILKDESSKTIAQALLRTRCDAVAVYASEDALIHSAIAQLHSRGIPVVTLISDIPQSMRIAYAGPDHYMSGRSAGYFITKMIRKSGPIAVLCNRRAIRSHSERIRGFADYLRQNPAAAASCAIIEGGDDRVRSEAQLRRFFQDNPDTVAVYNVGAANLGVAAAIRANLLPERPIFVGHELTPHTVDLLREGVMWITIDQSPELQARLAVNLIVRAFNLTESNIDPTVFNTKPVPIVLYGPENIPSSPFN